MPGSDRGAFATARVAGSLVLVAGLVWASAYVLATARTSLRLYSRPFGGAVAHKFAGALSKAAQHRPSVLLLGVSSTREGFDEEAMDRSAPGWSFLNGGTSIVNVFVYEALAEMTRDYSAHPTIVVIGLHPVALCDREVNFNGAGYTDFFDRWHGWDILVLDDPRFVPGNRREAFLNTVWPGHRFSRQLSRLVRRGLLTLHRRLYWGTPLLSREAFEHSPDDLRPQARYFYADTAPLPNGAANGVLWFEETISECAAPRHRESLRRTLENALAATPRVVVLLMPEHSLLRERVSAPLRGALMDGIAEYQGRVVVLDRSEAIPDALFRDAVHLLAEGRAQFSREVARDVVRLWPRPSR